MQLRHFRKQLLQKYEHILWNNHLYTISYYFLRFFAELLGRANSPRAPTKDGPKQTKRGVDEIGYYLFLKHSQYQVKYKMFITFSCTVVNLNVQARVASLYDQFTNITSATTNCILTYSEYMLHQGLHKTSQNFLV